MTRRQYLLIQMLYFLYLLVENPLISRQQIFRQDLMRKKSKAAVAALASLLAMAVPVSAMAAELPTDELAVQAPGTVNEAPAAEEPAAEAEE